MQALNIDRRLLVPSICNGRLEEGAFSFIARSPHIEMVLKAHYGRDGLCLKVFKAKAGLLSEFCWSADTGIKLTMCTKAQNLFARRGYAPRVYDIALINNEHWAQVTDYVEDDGWTFDREGCHRDVVLHYPIGSRGGDSNERNRIGSQYADHQRHYLSGQYEQAMKERVRQSASWGARPEPYQDIPDLGLESQRNTGHRLVKMRWDEMSFVGKTVLDVGCNLGAFCQAAYRRGAGRIVGVDKAHVADVAFEVANWFGYWNIDYEGLRLPAESGKIAQRTGIEQFDMVLALSCRQVEPLTWVFPYVGEVLYLEGHSGEHRLTYRAALEAEFAEVEFLESTTDHGVRPLFRCWRK